VLIAGNDQCRGSDCLHLVHEVEQRRSPLLNATHGERRAFGRIAGKLVGELLQPRGSLFWNCTRDGAVA
jgi:hypothetical protein